MKRIISLFLIISVFFSLNSCTKNESAEDKKTRVISEATAYLKENYPDDKFTYLEGRSPNSAYNYYELGFTSKNYNNQEVTVFGVPTEEENNEGMQLYHYYDSYYQYYMNEDAEKYFYDITKKYISDDIVVKALFGSSIGFVEKVDNKLDFATNYQKGNIDFFLYIFTENDSKENENAINNMITQFKNDGNKLWVRYVITDNLSEVSDLTIESIRDDFSKYCIKKTNYSTESEKNNSDDKWGKYNVTNYRYTINIFR